MLNDLDVILHGFIWQTIYTTVFLVIRLNNRTLNSENRGVNITCGTWCSRIMFLLGDRRDRRSNGSWIYNYLCNQCLLPLMLRVRIPTRERCTTLCDKVCQWIATGRWNSPGPPVSSTNTTDRHDITEILLKVALNTIKQTTSSYRIYIFIWMWMAIVYCIIIKTSIAFFCRF